MYASNEKHGTVPFVKSSTWRHKCLVPHITGPVCGRGSKSEKEQLIAILLQIMLSHLMPFSTCCHLSCRSFRAYQSPILLWTARYLLHQEQPQSSSQSYNIDKGNLHSAITLVPFCLQPVPCHAMQVKQIVIHPPNVHASTSSRPLKQTSYADPRLERPRGIP